MGWWWDGQRLVIAQTMESEPSFHPGLLRPRLDGWFIAISWMIAHEYYHVFRHEPSYLAQLVRKLGLGVIHAPGCPHGRPWDLMAVPPKCSWSCHGCGHGINRCSPHWCLEYACNGTSIIGVSNGLCHHMQWWKSFIIWICPSTVVPTNCPSSTNAIFLWRCTSLSCRVSLPVTWWYTLLDICNHLSKLIGILRTTDHDYPWFIINYHH